MKKTIIIILIYLLGCVCSYKLFKYQLTKDFPYMEWTIKDRNVCILFASLSWVSFISIGVFVALDEIYDRNKEDLDKPASW